MTTDRLAGIAEVADLLGVTKQTAIKYASRTDFPQPLGRLAAGPVWRRGDVVTWATTTLPLRAGRPRGPADDPGR